MIIDKKIICDFCEAEEEHDIVGNSALAKWSGGIRGKTFSVLPYSEFANEIVKHGCSRELCQAKLLAWSRS